jgi:signal transduction histidine kinase
MIDFYKLENLYISPVPQSFQPHTLIADLCAAHAICVNTGVALTYEVSAEVPSAVVADANFLKHAVSNVLGNALRFTHEGYVHALVTADALGEGRKRWKWREKNEST